MKIGFLENSQGEKSHTKLIHFIVAFCIMVGWCIVSGLQHRLVEIPLSLVGLLGVCMTGSGIKQWVDKLNPESKAKVVEKVIGQPNQTPPKEL